MPTKTISAQKTKKKISVRVASVIDRSDMRSLILHGATQFSTGLDAVRGVAIPKGPFDRIMISGMGGSALPGNLLRTYFADRECSKFVTHPFEIFQNRFYTLPKEARHNCLNFFCSYSGNTEETIAAFQQAHAEGLPSVGVSHGGKIAELCAAWGVPHIEIPKPTEDFQPRMATGFFFGILVQALISSGNVTAKAADDIRGSVTELDRLIRTLEKKGQQLAAKLTRSIPVVYASTHFKSLAMIWKIKFNENSKIPAFWNFFPELNHNEMVGFTRPTGRFTVILLEDPDDHVRNRTRFSVTRRLLEQNGVATERIALPAGKGVFMKIFWTLALGDWTSYHVALLLKQDPTPVDMVEALKKKLAAVAARADRA